MATKILMPALSPTMTEGSITKWLVNVGDKIKAGDILAEIETDKATMEIEATDDGVVTKLLIQEGVSGVAVNSAIAILDGEAEELKKENIDENYNSIDYKNSTEKVFDKKSIKNNIFDNKSKHNLLDQKIISSPYVRNISKLEGIKLENILGSGPEGRIVKRDLKIIKNKFLSTNSLEDKVITPSSIRKIIANSTTTTKQTVPHFYLSIESNVDKLLELRKKINKNSDTKVSLNDIFVKALALAQKKNLTANASWVDNKIIKHETIDVSIAVALKEGLITPIVKNADKKGIKEISNEIKDLVQKSKKGRLLPDEYNGGTISISNLGMFGITDFSAIINAPQSSILAIGAIKKIPGVVKNDEIKVINVLKSTLSADHRVLDGAVAAKLLKDFSDIIEDPFNLWLVSDDMEII